MFIEGPRPTAQEVFAQYPAFERVFNQSLRIIGDTAPGEYHVPEMATQAVGRVVLGEVGKFGAVEPFRSNWQDHVFHWEMIRAHYKGEPNPFSSFDGYLVDVRRDWMRHDGLADPTIVPVLKDIMVAAGLWTDAGVRALVVTSLVNRGDLQFTSSDNLRDHFQELVYSHFMGTKKDAIALINYLADNASEMGGKSPVSSAREVSTDNNPSEQDGVMPDGFVFMDDDSWNKFMRTNIGKRLGVFSTVSWFTGGDGDDGKEDLTEHHKALRRIRDFCAQSLQPYLDKPEYRQFIENPDLVITKALIEFIKKP